MARFGEARVLREAGIRAPILVLGMATAEEVDEAIAADVTLTLHSLPALELFAARARAAGVKCVQNDCIFREHAARPELHRKLS